MHIIASNGRDLTAESGGGLNVDPGRGAARDDALVADRTAEGLAAFTFTTDALRLRHVTALRMEIECDRQCGS